MLKVAVALPAMTAEVGEYLADVTALEAAGVHAVWVGDSGPDPSVVLGALAAITHRMGLGCLITSAAGWPAAPLGRAAGALQTLSRGRIMVKLPADGVHEEQLAALRESRVTVFSSDFGSASADGVNVAVESADQVTGARVARIETWAAIPAPPDRDTWNSAVAACEAGAVTGVIVPWSDRLIDLLRNPEPDDRTDLLMSTG